MAVNYAENNVIPVMVACLQAGLRGTFAAKLFSEHLAAHATILNTMSHRLSVCQQKC